ncbi:MAG: methylated-DNA--[protein]-cysteine S-methyltransferase [Thermomicrobiales bacterium]
MPESESSQDESRDVTFPQRVWSIVVQIPPGSVTTYGTIAAVLGNRRAARMVGWALNSCPEDVGEHAHRVVNRYGELSGGWNWGHPDVMKHLLEDEGIEFVEEYRVNLDRHLWIPPMEDNPAGCG